MVRKRRRWTILVGLLTAVWATGPLVAMENSCTGVWKATVTLVPAGMDLGFAVVQIKDQDGNASGQLLSVPPHFQGAALVRFQAESSGLRFQIKTDSQTIPICVIAPKTRGEAKVLLGSIWMHNRPEPLRLERTDLKELDPKESRKSANGAADFRSALSSQDVKEREVRLQGIVQKYAGQSMACAAAQAVFEAKAQDKVNADELKSAAARYFEAAAPFGPDLQLAAVIDIADALKGRDDVAALALDYALRGVRLLAQTDPPIQGLGLLQTLASALRKHGQGDEAKAVSERIARIERILDEKSEQQTALIPEKERRAGSKATGSRVVLVELFTGAHCAYCPNAVRACDALLRTYDTNRMLLLQYHIAGPLICAESMARSDAYGKQVPGTPTVLIDGKTEPLPGGAKENYHAFQRSLEKALKVQTEVRLKLSAQHVSGRYEVSAQLDGLKKSAGKALLHFVLVEEEVHFPGHAGVRMHRHVVRSFPGGVRGFAIKGDSVRQAVTIDPSALRKNLQKYLNETPDNAGEPPENGWPLELRGLKVIAFLQDAGSKEVLQAAQVDLPGTK